MQHSSLLANAASRLLAELMPVSVVVAGPGCEDFAAALADAGAAASVLEASPPEDAFDLAVLLADVVSLDTPETRSRITALSALSERLLFVPASIGGEAPELAALTAWFEPLADLGYQPVVDFDAQFLARGAFLVDRAATAAESDLATFADLVSGAIPPSAVFPAADVAPAAYGGPPSSEQGPGDTAALEQEVVDLRSRLAMQQATAESLRLALAAAETQNAGWDGLRQWATRRVLSEARSLAALRTARADSGVPAPRGLFGRRRANAAERALLQEAALLRACPLFDPAWYIASVPELAKTGGDPLLHFLLTGGPAGRDPGPWFETASYVQANPRAAAEKIPLLHAIRTGSATAPPPDGDEPG